MEQILSVDNKLIHFKLNEGANCWQTRTSINNVDLEIEIDFQFHKEKEVNWDRFRGFYAFVNKEERLKKLIDDSQNLVNELGKAFYRESANEVLDYKMEFANSIFYNGKTDGAFIKDGYSYSLIFNYFAKRDNGTYGDEYGLYLVDIENHFIVGTRRYQC
ncbi:hypothetical protein [Pseudochryseolinea flava]|nr:hypothetical protein [Pseudochryseolinea flava]